MNNTYRWNQNKISEILYRETLAATAGTGCIRVVKVETFAVQPIGEIKFGTGQVQERFHIQSQADAFVFKKLIAFFDLVIKIKVIR